MDDLRKRLDNINYAFGKRRRDSPETGQIRPVHFLGALKLEKITTHVERETVIQTKKRFVIYYTQNPRG